MPATDILAPVAIPAAWFGRDLRDQPDLWRQSLTGPEIGELYDLARRLRSQHDDLLALTCDSAPLPLLGERLAGIRDEILRGRGFALLRGLPVDEHTLEENAWAYWIIGLHLGNAVPQNGKNHMLGHVTDLGLDYAKPEVRGYQTNSRLAYHCDYSDVVGLLCIRPAKSGGLSSIVSSVTLYNELLRRAPDLAGELTKPIVHTRWGEIPEGKAPWAETPVFNPLAGTVITSYVRSAIRKGQLLDGAPPVSERQERACDALDALAAETELHLDMELKPGDMQFLNNHWILHSRTTYEDHAEPGRRRHLLRLWLACADGPPLPRVMTDGFQGGTVDGRPNGISVPGRARIASLDPREELLTN